MKRKILVFILLVIGIQLNAQSRFNLEGSSVFTNLSDDLVNWNQAIEHNKALGYQLVTTYSYKIKKLKLEPRIGGGFKYLSIEGTSGSTDFSAETYRLILLVGADYYVNKRWRVGLDLTLENNRNFEDFRTRTNDLFRYNMPIKARYKIYKRLSVTAFYSLLLYPHVDRYLITNPEHQFGLGLHYNFIKL